MALTQPAFQSEPVEYTSPEEYLRLERAADFKHEYFQGKILAMAGDGYLHNLICANLTIETGSRLRGKSCSVVGSNQRLQIMSASAFVYPDLTVVCGKPEFNEGENTNTLLNPTLLTEVTSASTAAQDHYDKFTLYRQIASLRQYLMLSSEAVHAELYTLDEPGRWVLTETRDLAAVLDLNSIGCQVPLTEVYAGVEFPEFQPDSPTY